MKQRKSNEGEEKYQGVSYSKRYELLCRRLVMERLYNSSCFLDGNERETHENYPAR